MTKFIAGFILGIVVSTIGVTGLFNIADNGIKAVQSTSKEISKQ